MTNQTIKAGHKAAADWYADLNTRLSESHPYLVRSGLLNAVVELPPADAIDFLDSLGAMIVGWLGIGRPAPGYVFGADYISRQSLTPAEQDALEADDD